MQQNVGTHDIRIVSSVVVYRILKSWDDVTREVGLKYFARRTRPQTDLGGRKIKLFCVVLTPAHRSYQDLI